MYKNNYRKALLSEGLILYFIVILIFGTLQILSPYIKTDRLTLVMIVQTFAIMLPCAVYLYLKGKNGIKSLNLSRIKTNKVFWIFALSIPLFVCILTANYILFFLSDPNNINNLSRPEYSYRIITLVKVAIAYILMPAIWEEVLFRGILLSGLKAYGDIKAIIITSFLFTLLHFNLESMLGTFLLGLVTGIVVIALKSIYAGILIHIINNAIALYGIRLSTLILSNPAGDMYKNAISLFAIFMCSFVLLLFIIINIKKPYRFI